MRKRKRIDWEKEMQKTEDIRMRGFRTSVFGFVIAVMFLLGASRVNKDASVFSVVIMIGCFLAAIVILIFTLKRRAAKLKKIRDEEYEEFKEKK
jgi:phosphotransferase system  glucose/maltose/N-acetylglucosamine-specific IIC component